MNEETNNYLLSVKIGLALSGGGVRSIAFHAGVLEWLATQKLLERVEHISSVSGGSLFTGLVYHYMNGRWPTSHEYIEKVLPRIRLTLTTKSLQFNALGRLVLNPLNWRLVLSRADILAKSIKSLWGITSTLGELPAHPIWSINATTAENGRRFRFKNFTLGDYELGYTLSPKFELSSAMAISAAFPAGIGPLTLGAEKYEWRKRSTWDSTKPADIVKLPFKEIHLYDGGIYDNLGLEPLFDVGKQAIKKQINSPINYLILSDAGSPYSREGIPGPLHPFRLKRVADVMADQIRGLRVRSFINFLQNNKNNHSNGMYLQIGTNPKSKIKDYSQLSQVSTETICSMKWLSKSNVEAAKSIKTSLNKISLSDFVLLARHGFETAKWNDLIFCKQII